MFKLIKIENARMNVPEPVFHEVTEDEAVVMGEALVLTNGKLTKCGATVKPEFIAMADCVADATKRLIPAARVEEISSTKYPYKRLLRASLRVAK